MRPGECSVTVCVSLFDDVSCEIIRNPPSLDPGCMSSD